MRTVIPPALLFTSESKPVRERLIRASGANPSFELFLRAQVLESLARGSMDCLARLTFLARSPFENLPVRRFASFGMTKAALQAAGEKGPERILGVVTGELLEKLAIKNLRILTTAGSVSSK